MIIGIDAHMIGDHSGGNESYFTNYLMNVKVDSNDVVYIFVAQGVDVSIYENSFRIVRFSTESPFKRYFFELDRICKKLGVEVLHTQFFIPFFRSCKVVCTIHDICFEHFDNIFTRREYYRQKILIPYAARKSEYILTVSEYSKKDIIEHYGIDASKVIVAYSGASDQFKVLSRDEIIEDELRARYGIGDVPYVLSVGNLQPRKNMPMLIQAFHEWRIETKSEAKLVIVGKKAWMYSDIFRMASVDIDNIVFTDYVSTGDLVRLYNAAKAFIYPSIFEGFGLPPIEAMACGTPVAVANTSSLPEVVDGAAILFNPYSLKEIKDALKKLTTDDELRGVLREKGLIRKDAFRWTESARKIYETYHLCEQRKQK